MFLDRCKKYKIEEGIDAELGEGATMDKRAMKIARYKAEKKCKERLEELLKLEELRSKADEGGGGGSTVGGGGSVADEESDRERWILVIQSAMRKASDSIGLAEQEMEMLVHMEKMRSESASRSVLSNGESTDARTKHFQDKDYEDREGLVSVRGGRVSFFKVCPGY
jgi:hypothetical protein